MNENFLLNNQPRPAKGRVWETFREHFKRSFRLFAKAHLVQCPVDFGVQEFAYLCDTVDVRHRITHPKSFVTFRVTDDEKKQAGRAIDWLSAALQALLAAAHGKQALSVPTDKGIRPAEADG